MLALGMSCLGGKHSFFASPATLESINKIEISNAKFDDLYVSKDAALDINAPREWTYATILYAQFNNDLLAGNVDFTLENVDAIRLKRRIKGTFNWITYLEKEVNSEDDLNIVYFDRLPLNGETYEYVLVPMKNGIENTYQSAEITPNFEGLFILEKDKIYHTDLNIGQFENVDSQRNFQVSQIETLENKYPITIFNSNTNYDTGSITATFVEVNKKRNIIDWEGGFKYREEFSDYLTNKKYKVLKYDTGQGWLITIDGNSVSDAANGHKLNVSTTFNWKESGSLNSSTDLYNAGFTEVNVEGS